MYKEYKAREFIIIYKKKRISSIYKIIVYDRFKMIYIKKRKKIKKSSKKKYVNLINLLLVYKIISESVIYYNFYI